MFNYGPLWKTMEEKNVTTYRLIQEGIDAKIKYSLQGTTQGRYLTGGVPPVRFSM